MEQIPQQEHKEENINLYEILFKYLVYWHWFVAGVVVMLICAWLWLRYQAPVYNVQASVLIQEQDKRSNNAAAGPLAAMQDLGVFSMTNNFDNEVEILRSRTLLKKVVTTLNLYTNLSGGYGDYSSTRAGYSNKGWDYNGFLGARWNAWKDGAISANVGYYSGFRMLVGTSAPLAFCGFSVSQSFFEKRLQVNLSVSDPFSKERKFTMHIKNDAYRIDSYNYNPCQYIRLGITYSFGQMKDSVKKARRSINNDDLKSSSSGTGGGSTPSGMGGGGGM